jgi:carboxylesterase
VSHAALLVHGFLGSPADFGDLPQRLAERGIGSRSLRLPGHATGPSILDEVTAEEYLTAVESARQDLASKYGKVSIVGFSFGGALAVRSAADAPPHRLVLVNPWFGKFVTPGWSPVDADRLLTISAATTPRVMRPNGMIHVYDESRIPLIRAYSTVRTKATSEARAFTRAAAAPEVAAKIGVPTLVLVSDNDRTIDPPTGLAWFEALPLPPERKKLLRFTRSDHLLFQDFDREEACRAVAAFLSSQD